MRRLIDIASVNELLSPVTSSQFSDVAAAAAADGWRSLLRRIAACLLFVAVMRAAPSYDNSALYSLREVTR